MRDTEYMLPSLEPKQVHMPSLSNFINRLFNQSASLVKPTEARLTSQYAGSENDNTFYQATT